MADLASPLRSWNRVSIRSLEQDTVVDRHAVYISVAVAVIAVIIHYANVAIPYVHSGFVILLIGYLVLLAGNVLEGV